MKVNILTTILLKYWFSPPLYLQGSEHVSFELLYHHDIIFWFNYSKLKDTQSNSISGKNALTIDLFLNNIKHTYGYICIQYEKKLAKMRWSFRFNKICLGKNLQSTSVIIQLVSSRSSYTVYLSTAIILGVISSLHLIVSVYELLTRKILYK